MGSPPGEEERETDGLEDAGESSNGNSVEWSLLSGDLCNELMRLVVDCSPCVMF